MRYSCVVFLFLSVFDLGAINGRSRAVVYRAMHCKFMKGLQLRRLSPLLTSVVHTELLYSYGRL